jgi:DNA-binding beta-propeller fold protein YncE
MTEGPKPRFPEVPSRRSVAMGALLVLLALLALAAGRLQAAPGGQTGRLVQPAGKSGCIHRSGVNRCQRGRAVTSPQDIAISPDGRHAYVAAYGSNAVAIFARSNGTGALRQLPGRRGCIGHEGAGPCGSARALARPSAVAVSPDGRNVYVTASASGALAVFARNRKTGAIRQLAGANGCVSQRPGGGCAAGRALNEPVAVTVSPDGAHVYVANRRFPSAVAVLSRSGDGTLTQDPGPSGCMSRGGMAGCVPARALISPEDVVVSRDSQSVLVASSGSRAVLSLRTGPAGLTQPGGSAGCIANGGAEGCAVGHALQGPVELALAPDGRGLYVASSASDAVSVLGRNRRTGELRQARGKPGCLSHSGGGAGRCGVGRALDEVWGVAVSPDGRNVYHVSAKVNAMGINRRDTTTGRLTPLPGRRGCFIRGGVLGCPEGRGLTVAVAVTVSPDGRNVYVVSEDAYLGAIAIFRRFLR